jgi:hypothetical protein
MSTQCQANCQKWIIHAGEVNEQKSVNGHRKILVDSVNPDPSPVTICALQRERLKLQLLKSANIVVTD